MEHDFSILDETVTFDYLKPDFSILKGRRLALFAMQPEYIFYLKHRVIHWINQLNESFDTEINFDSIKIDRYLVADNRRTTVVFGFKNISGHLEFYYDSDEVLKNISLYTELGIYSNNIKFPNTCQFFTVEANINTHNEILDYEVERSMDMTETSYDDFMVRYSFTPDGNKTKDLLVLYNYKSNNEDMVLEADFELMGQFDEFFNKNISVILQSLETFIAMYPQFSISVINNDETLALFYAEMKKMYKDGAFNEGLDENLTIIKMLTI